jgi:hypothetical protein
MPVLAFVSVWIMKDRKLKELHKEAYQTVVNMWQTNVS